MRLAFVLLALSLRVLIPPGFMPGVSADGGVPLVICTGHGPAISLGGHQSPGHPDKAAPPCAFAAHVLGPTPPTAATPMGSRAVYAVAAAAPAADLTPGRGLAAPPPPARGPPTLL